MEENTIGCVALKTHFNLNDFSWIEIEVLGRNGNEARAQLKEETLSVIPECKEFLKKALEKNA
jgi:hypothetical protein